MLEPDKDLLRKALARALTVLAATGRLVIVEVGIDGIGTFVIHRDEHDTPRCHHHVTAWGELATPLDPRALIPADSTEIVLVRSFAYGVAALQAVEALCATYSTPVHIIDQPVLALVKEIISADPVRRSYDLVVLRPDPRTKLLALTGIPLFPIGTRPGALTDIVIRCEPADEHGTAFAVVTWEGRLPRLLSVESTRLTPGRHQVTAELVRAGQVRFKGLPNRIPDDRDWADLIRSVPCRLPDRAAPTHLICAVEVCGADTKVAERLSRVRQVVAFLADALADRLRVSLVAYGAHSFGHSGREQRVEVAAWRTRADQALATLHRLEDRGAITQGYPYHPFAAQLEDMLSEVTEGLHRDGPPQEGTTHTVVLTVGDRPPHPARTDRSGTLPCPHRLEWESSLGLLGSQPRITFGAICDRPPNEAHRSHPIWRYLGQNLLAHLDALDVEELTENLDLIAPAIVPLPFPLIEETE